MAVAHVLANEPLVMTADELTGNRDTTATNEVLRLFAGLRDMGQTLVLVTHDGRIAVTADQLISMGDGVGQVLHNLHQLLRGLRQTVRAD
uniref:hypothetical protein n=1 Tax=Herbidospora sakaeratensis TaxID=564415 RepID=UPI000785C8C1|nr:hypothetical protein [Herbidospora sakaeratensis]